jgi:hypothetical protein
MSRSANVQSVQTLKDFKVAMINYSEDARNALSGVDMELRRMRDWLERDQLGYWQMQVKRRTEDLMQARSDLHRKKISQQGSDAKSDTEQKENLREAMRRLRVAEEKVALVKRLIPQLHHAIAEYHSHSQPLADHLTGGFERSVLSVERMVLALEAYIATVAPSAPRMEPAAVSSGAATTAGASTSSGSAEPADGDGSTAATAAAEPAEPADGQAASATATATVSGTETETAPATAGQPVTAGGTS